MSEKNINPTRVVTGKGVRLSYANVLKPVSINGSAPKFSTSIIIPKSDESTIRDIKNAIKAAYKDGEAKLKGNGKTVPPLSSIKIPLRDGDVDRPDDPAYQNAYFINANSTLAPGIVDGNCNPINDPAQVYSGVYGRVSVTFYAYNSNGNRGIACGLQNIQVLEAGEPLGGRASAASDFATEEESDFLD